MTTRTPLALKDRRAQLAYERVQLGARMAELDTEIAALDYALRVIDPDWAPPRRVSKPCRQALLPRGAVAQSCLQLLRQNGQLWTSELCKLVTERYKLSFNDRRTEQDFASSVAMALRRYERQGLVETVDKDSKTGMLRWKLRLRPDGRLALLRSVA